MLNNHTLQEFAYLITLALTIC